MATRKTAKSTKTADQSRVGKQATSKSTGIPAPKSSKAAAAKTSTPQVKATVKKAASRKSITKAPVVKKSVAKKPVAGKSPAKNSVSKKAVSKKAVSKQAASKQAVTKKAASKQAVTKNALAKKTAAKKLSATKISARRSVSKQSELNTSVAAKAVHPASSKAMAAKQATAKTLTPEAATLADNARRKLPAKSSAGLSRTPSALGAGLARSAGGAKSEKPARRTSPRQALAATRKRLEDKQAHDREVQPWQRLDSHQTQVPEPGFQSNEAREAATELHAAESRLKAMHGSVGTQDRRSQGKRDHR